ncbi:hypothetical protein B0H19DRAFT_1080480 [Mycena capillaripes]|nr:hypothetical protein B0H19DRAFT_1080480 [Mycena capillaripes]
MLQFFTTAGTVCIQTSKDAMTTILESHKELKHRHHSWHFSAVFIWGYMCLTEQRITGKGMHIDIGRFLLKLLQDVEKYMPSFPGKRLSMTPPSGSASGVGNNRFNVATGLSLHLLLASTPAASTTVKLGFIRHSSGPEYESSIELAFTSNCGFYDFGWSTRDPNISESWLPINHDREGSSVLKNGWIRVSSASVADAYANELWSLTWLSQAVNI